MINLIFQIPLFFLLSFLLQFLLIKSFSRNGIYIDHSEEDKPQRFHTISTTKAGGLGIFIASIISLGIFGNEGVYIIISMIPVFFIGLYEDIRPNISPGLRMLFTGIGVALAIILIDTVIYDIGLFKLPLWIAIPFTFFAAIGITNAINIIDGFNGLASGVSIIALLFISLTSYIYGEQWLLAVSLGLAASIAGFFLWNFPRGKIFLGDGGAYLIGFQLTIISILLVKKIPDISPWFPAAVLAYPIFETFFSIYRKKFKRGTSAFMPDKLHLHMLIFKRITRNNPKTSIFILLPVFFFECLAFAFHSNTPALIIIIIMFSFSYVSLYKSIVRFSYYRKPFRILHRIISAA